MMKKIWIMAISLLLAITCTASALADSAMYATPLSLKDKIQKAKDRSYVNDGNTLADSWKEAKDTADRIKSKSASDHSGSSNAGDSSGADTVLPSVLEMDGADDFSISEKKNYDTYCKIVFKAYDPDQLDFAREYVNSLVENYGYELSYEGIGESKYSGYSSSVWYLQHSDFEVGSDEPYEEEGRECDVFIRLNQYFEDGDCTLAVYHVSDLSHADADEAGSNDGGSSSSRKSCSTCGGDGRCDTCGGSGQVWKWAGDMYAYVRCTAFGCSGGRCTRCS